MVAEFFIKEFQPDHRGSCPGSPKTAAKQRKMCGLRGSSPRARALAPLSAYGGINLIVTLDFFRWGAKYYKVTEKVDASGFSAADVAT